MSPTNPRDGQDTGPDRPPSSRDRSEESAAPSLAELIAEAEALHAALGDARAGAGRLLSALRRRRKHDRLVRETVQSLKRLGLADVAG